MKVILIQGDGDGKTFIGNLLERFYLKNSIPCERVFLDEDGSALRRLKRLSQKEGYAIVETNKPRAEKRVDPWQTITIGGGREI